MAPTTDYRKKYEASRQEQKWEILSEIASALQQRPGRTLWLKRPLNRGLSFIEKLEADGSGNLIMTESYPWSGQPDEHNKVKELTLEDCIDLMENLQQEGVFGQTLYDYSG